MSKVVYAVGDCSAAVAGGSAINQACKALVPAASGLDEFWYLGDVYADGTNAEYTNTFDPLWGSYYAAGKGHATPGNHGWANHASGFDAYHAAQMSQFGGKHYGSYMLGDWMVVWVNSMEGASTSQSPVPESAIAFGGSGGAPLNAASQAMLDWLTNLFAANPGTAKIVCWHHDVWASGGHGDLQQMKPLWNLIVGGAALLLVGHTHNQEQHQPRNKAGSAVAWDNGATSTIEVVNALAGNRDALVASYTPALVYGSDAQGTKDGVVKLVLSSGGLANPTADLTFLHTDGTSHVVPTITATALGGGGGGGGGGGSHPATSEWLYQAESAGILDACQWGMGPSSTHIGTAESFLNETRGFWVSDAMGSGNSPFNPTGKNQAGNQVEVDARPVWQTDVIDVLNQPAGTYQGGHRIDVIAGVLGIRSADATWPGHAAIDAWVPGDGSYVDQCVSGWADLMLQAPRRFLVRLWHEMGNGIYNDTANNWSLFISNWRKIYDRWVELGAVAPDKARVVWCPASHPQSPGDDSAKWPGGAWVDWIGRDSYIDSASTWEDSTSLWYQSFNPINGPLNPEHRPMIICESGDDSADPDRVTKLNHLFSLLKTTWKGISGWVWWDGAGNDLVDTPAGFRSAMQTGLADPYFLPDGLITATPPPQPPANTTPPSLSDTTPTQGVPVSCNKGVWSGSGISYAYQWQTSPDGASGWVNASGAGAKTSTYTPAAADVGRHLLCVVTATNANGSGQASTSASSAVTASGGGGSSDPLVVPEYSSPPRFILAATGQQILLRGVNTIQTAAQADRQAGVAALGCNMVRVVTNWDKFEPNAPAGSGSDYSAYTHTLDAAALAQLDSDLAYYASQGIYFQLDFHQAAWSPYFGGAGVPSWYYTGSRFAGGKYAQGATSPDKSTAIKNWWVDAAESVMSQQLYIGYVEAMVSHVLAQSYAPYLVGYQVFNEPNAGKMSGTSQQKTANMHKWLAPVVDAIHALDPLRAKFVMCRGGGQGFGSATYAAFGDLATKRVCLEFHQYYTGLKPGYPAVGGTDVGYNQAGDDYYPNSAACHTTTSGDSYHGAEAYQEAFMGVPLGKAQSLGVPAFMGEMGVHPNDSGRLNYVSDVQTALDKLKVSGTVWKMGRYPGDSLGILDTNGNLLDTGQAWQTWFKATQYVIGGSTATPPSCTTNPSISTLDPVEGQVITTDGGVWAGSPDPTLAYTWQHQTAGAWEACTGGGQGTTEYVVDATDQGLPLRVKVTGTNASGSVKAHSAQTNPVIAAPPSLPVCTASPALGSAAAAKEGVAETVTTGSWTNTPTSYAYQWQRRDPATGTVTPISGATASSYTPTKADEAYQLACLVTASNQAGAGDAALSNYTIKPPLGPSPILHPTLSDTSAVLVGEVLELNFGLWTPTPDSYTFKWQTDGGSGGVTWTDIIGETGPTYTVKSGDVGAELRGKVIAADQAGTNSVATTPTLAVVAGAGEPVTTQTPLLDHTVVYEGDVIVVTDPVVSPAATSFSYQWRRQTPDGSPAGVIVGIAGATSKQYTAQAADVGSRLYCVVTATNAAGSHATNTPRTSLVQSGAVPSYAVTFDVPLDAAIVHNAQLSITVEIVGTPSGAQARADGGAWAPLAPAGMNGSRSVWTGSVTLLGGDGLHTIEAEAVA